MKRYFTVIFAFLLICAHLDALGADAKQIAAEILDGSKSNPEREALIAAQSVPADALILALTADLKVGTKDEYVRIPWIWRVAIAAGKRNDLDEIQRILEVSIPKIDAPLDDWRAVVIGGGIINGITQAGGWPGERIVSAIKDHPSLKARHLRSLDLASQMTDNTKVANGTRYDALRMLGVDRWEDRGSQILRYLPKGTNAELQMGAVSALGDIQGHDEVISEHLIKVLPDLNARNRTFAVEALVRNEARAILLLDGIEAGKVDKKMMGEKVIESLKTHPSQIVKTKAHKVFDPQ